MYKSRVATLEDTQHIAANLRDADLQEFSLGSKDPYWVLLNGVAASDDVQVLTYDDQPYFMGGVAVTPIGNIVWACGTNAVKEHVQNLLADSELIIEGWLEDYGLLQNLIWAGNKTHMRWLKHMGFTLDNTYSHNNETYQHFYKGAPLCVPQAH